MYNLIVIGGGVAGFFAAINFARKNPKQKILILERSTNYLSKLRIFQGGIGVVAPGKLSATALSKNFPRGSKESVQLFKLFGTAEIVDWLEKSGIKTEISEDGKIVDVSNSSNTIVDYLLKEAERLKIEVQKEVVVEDLMRKQGVWNIILEEETLTTEKILITSGGNKMIWGLCAKLGHDVVPAVSSLFSFSISNAFLQKVVGEQFPNAHIGIVDTDFETEGEIQVTNEGLGGNAVLQLSSLAARQLHDLNYNFIVHVNWLNISHEEASIALHNLRVEKSERKVSGLNPFDLSKSFWQGLVKMCKLDAKKYTDLNDADIQLLTNKLCRSVFQVIGRKVNMSEFVTAGGIKLDEVDLKTMESKLRSNLFFAGEVLNIDGFSGGYNVQTAWTTSWIAAQGMS